MKTNTPKIKQEFSFNAPDVISVMLVGDFTDWQKRPIPLTRRDNGRWRATIGLNPGTYHYRFLVDGEWRDDPQCTLRVPNRFGTEDAVRTVTHRA